MFEKTRPPVVVVALDEIEHVIRTTAPARISRRRNCP
jgi:hypothetical protein